MPAQYVTSIVEGQDFYVADIDPTGVVSAPRGSVCLRVDSGNALVYYNVTVANSPGTTWVPMLTTDWTDIGTQITLLDNANPALQVGPAGFLDLLKFITTNGAEQIVMRSSAAAVQITGGFGLEFTGAAAQIKAVGASALLDVGANAQSNTAAASGLAALVTADYTIPANASGVDVDTTFVLPAGRPLSVVDAYVVSSGTAAGSIQARTTTGGITNAMVPGATLNAITRPTTVAGNTIAAGGSLVARAATATIAGNVLRIVYKVA
jgi:hypothetical protein